MNLFNRLKQKIEGKNKKIVFPEGLDIRIIKAVAKLGQEHLIQPILLGNSEQIEKIAYDHNVNLKNVNIIDPEQYPVDKHNQMVESLVKRRNGKTSHERAEKWLQNYNYFGTMLVYMGLADGMVSGATQSTGATVLPALQIIKTKPGIKRVSGAFILQKHGERYIFADCAINITLDADTMAEVAIESANTAKMFDLDPKIAMLSFSTKGSAKGDMVTKVVEATKKVREEQPDLSVDGELQFDAALVPSVAKTKAPNSKVAGHSNVFVFPDLQSGNIGYKIAQRLGGFEALGPILQGLNQPVSDLSRGCNSDDVYKVAMINAIQSL
ncbi:phosphate acetyltransferase [Philodulcilactobacillus myokoensis]|uniref:Phosphate acetyltransferase n=1 Tax=Philodulcilactobacillus myokoensis TaxID=2929573 RepID=A0A9W6EST4_9LACO|nr:phosphate acetyltransferase [Philodulcilactobacillus myokoensis]GLB47120.1 phosphate acetyltransferase [Philodulcilactobacillus myokoensis]